MSGIETLAHFAEQIGDVDVHAADMEGVFIRSGQPEQVVGEGREPVDLAVGRSQRVRQLLHRSPAAQRELELDLQGCKWGAQLMARVRDERFLTGERSLQTVEHVVERGAEPADLVTGRWQWQPPAGLGRRHSGGTLTHKLNWAQ